MPWELRELKWTSNRKDTLILLHNQLVSSLSLVLGIFLGCIEEKKQQPTVVGNE